MRPPGLYSITSPPEFYRVNCSEVILKLSIISSHTMGVGGGGVSPRKSVVQKCATHYNVQNHYSQSRRENATSSSSKSPSARKENKKILYICDVSIRGKHNQK